MTTYSKYRVIRSVGGFREPRDGGDERNEPQEDDPKAHTPLAEEIAHTAALRLSKEDVSSGTAGVGSATYGGARDEDEDEDEEVEKSYPSFAKMDDELMKFYDRVVWWGLGEDDLDLSKAPNMWRSDEDVPEFVEEFVREAVQDDAFWQGDFEQLPPGAGSELQDIFEENMTQPQGWSLSSMADDIQDAFPGTTKEYALVVTRNEVAALANKARENAYEARPESDDYEFYWSGPSDFRETPVCRFIKEQTHPKHGGEPVDIETLRDVLERAIDPTENPHLDGPYNGATPGRIKDWVPHYQCRHSFVREVHL